MTSYEEYIERIEAEGDDPIDTEQNLIDILEEAEYDPEIDEVQAEYLYDLACEVYGHDLG